MLVDELTFQRNALQKEQNRRYKETMAATTAARAREAQVCMYKTDSVAMYTYSYECLTLLFLQHQQRAELKKKLEALAKYETVQRIKVNAALQYMYVHTL